MACIRGLLLQLTFFSATSNLAVSMAKVENLRKNLIEIGGSLYRSGMLAGTDGNLSARIDEKQVLVTRSSVPKGRLKNADFVIMDLDGKLLKSKDKPST